MNNNNQLQDYPEFLATKQIIHPACGFEPYPLNKKLKPFQAKCTGLAIRKGRFALFEDTGLGKTPQQVEWSKQCSRYTVKPTLIVAPLSVARQTIREAKKILGYDVAYSRGEKVDCDLVITNYEMLRHFNQDDFGGICFDESSIFKAIDGKTYQYVVKHFSKIKYRLCCTATPNPNDLDEIGNQCEVLGIMTAAEMKATFFQNTGDTSEKWEMRKHGEEKFYRWLASWSMWLKYPSDIGFDDEGYVLPPLEVIPIFIETDWKPDGMLLNDGVLRGLKERNEVRRDTVDIRLQEVVRLAKKHKKEQIIIWNWLNDEANNVTSAIGKDAVNVQGSDKPEVKAKAFEDFQDNKFRVLVSKPEVGGFGMNFQNAHIMIYNGMTDSFEQVYQTIRREYRFGQKEPVTVYAVMVDAQKPIWENVQRKQKQADEMRNALIEHIKDFEKEEITGKQNGRYEYKMRTEQGKNWTAYQGDSCEILRDKIKTDSIPFSVFSPPFKDLFTYTATERDLGNSKTSEEFFKHFNYIIRELLRITMPGRNACVHVAPIPLQKSRVGYMGMDDFPGDVIRAFQAQGWIWWGKFDIDKNPQALKNGTKVLTSTGWKNIESFKQGDTVIGSDGKSTTVLGVYHHESRPMYRVSFNDGSFVECDANHLWSVQTRGRHSYGSKFITRRTDDLYGKLYSPSNDMRYEIPIVMPVEFEQSKELPIDPYLLGVLIGDGCLSSRSTVAMCTENEIASKLSLPLKSKVKKQTGTDKGNGTVATHHITHDEWHENPTLDGLREVGLYGLRAWEKFIPENYLRASIYDRIQLLRGLMDTDGTIKKNNAMIFSTTSQRLAINIQELVQSLGGLAPLRVETERRYKHKGQNKNGRPLFCVSIRLNWCPFSLERKKNRWREIQRTIRRRISNIEIVENSPCTCITVSNSDGLFVTENYIVTHNSQAIRTKAHALMFKTLKKDRAQIRPAIADQILIFKKPGENKIPIRPKETGSIVPTFERYEAEDYSSEGTPYTAIHSKITNETWIEWAHPIHQIIDETQEEIEIGVYGHWYGIQESDTLQHRDARDEDDCKHICPLQLETIERCIKLYTNPGELVLDPFGGIGSTGYKAIKLARKAVLCELKDSYFSQLVKNLNRAEQEAAIADVNLFSAAGVEI